MFVGHFAVGKTTLVNGLLERKRITKHESTDGIDIHLANCYYNRNTKLWKIEGN